MRLVLDATESISAEFRLSGGISFAQCDLHNGGTWSLQLKSPSGEWVTEESIAFTKKDYYQFRTPVGAVCRFPAVR